VLDALVSQRCYKQAWPLEQALQYLDEQSGTQFDPELVRLLQARLEAVRAIYERYPDE
jgi:response regulator RpfG family c-di-GMP phosphodiesterase